MQYKCNYNPDLNTVETSTCGAASLTELIDMSRCITELCSQKRSANIMIDHSELDASSITIDDVNVLSSLAVAWKDILKMRKCAHIANTEVQFGLVRTWEIMVEISGLTNFNMMVFRNRDDAIEWIRTSS
jgi:hypothetical protein